MVSRTQAMVSRTHSAPAPLLRSRMLLNNSNTDDDSTFHKIDSCFDNHNSDKKQQLLRTRSHTRGAGRGGVSSSRVGRMAALPSIKRNLARTQKDKKQLQQPKRRKPRVQSGSVVQGIESKQDFRRYTSKNGCFPVLIRDKSFRVIRQKNLERKLVQLPQYHHTDML